MGPGSRSLRFLGRDDAVERLAPARRAWINRAALRRPTPCPDCRLPTADCRVCPRPLPRAYPGPAPVAGTPIMTVVVRAGDGASARPS